MKGFIEKRALSWVLNTELYKEESKKGHSKNKDDNQKGLRECVSVMRYYSLWSERNRLLTALIRQKHLYSVILSHTHTRDLSLDGHWGRTRSQTG